MSPRSRVRAPLGLPCQVTRVWSKGLDLRSNAKRFVGSNPTSDIKKTLRLLVRRAVLAQLVERLTFNQVALGSSPRYSNMVPWCNRLAFWTLNPAIRVQIPAEPYISL